MCVMIVSDIMGETGRSDLDSDGQTSSNRIRVTYCCRVLERHS
jgi:hypothetical protein